MVASGESTYTEVSHDDGFPRRCVQRRGGPRRPSRLAPTRRPGARWRRAVRISTVTALKSCLFAGPGELPHAGSRAVVFSRGPGRADHRLMRDSCVPHPCPRLNPFGTADLTALPTSYPGRRMSIGLRTASSHGSLSHSPQAALPPCGTDRSSSISTTPGRVVIRTDEPTGRPLPAHWALLGQRR